MATAAAGRVLCPKCGANNFETQAACWKCGAPLVPGLGAPAVGAASGRGDMASPVARIVDHVDPSVAHWVGVIGGLLVPYFMLPVGFIFLMWDERRKVEIGRTATIASVVGSAIHLFITYITVYGLVKTGMQMLPGMSERAKAAQSQSQSAPDWNSEAKPLNLSGIPPMVPPK